MDSLLQQLPEVIEQIGRDIKAITVVLGRGRPDKPDTTGNKITGEEPKIKGNEPNGTIYESSDGGGVGAWKWQKRDKKWVVIDGDTGLVNAVTKNLKPGDCLVIWVKPKKGIYQDSQEELKLLVQVGFRLDLDQMTLVDLACLMMIQIGLLLVFMWEV